MSGICNTCSLKPRCISPEGGVVSCSLYEPKDKSRWFELFGTPERAARALELMCNLSRECSFCPLCGRAESICGDGDYDAILGWLRGDAE